MRQDNFEKVPRFLVIRYFLLLTLQNILDSRRKLRLTQAAIKHSFLRGLTGCAGACAAGFACTPKAE